MDSAWSIVARNLPQHANNPIHTDTGAQAAGFERALVAGVTSYAYCLHPVLELFGLDWVANGRAEVRFRSPVFDGDHVRFSIAERDDDGLSVDAIVDRAAQPLVNVSAWRAGSPVPSARDGEGLRPVRIILEGEYGSKYAEFAGDSLDLCRRAGVVHPAVWPALANYVFHRQLVRGPWVHTRSIVRHHGLVPVGSEAEISTSVVERFRRNGERAIADVVIRVDNVVVASLEHEAIIDLAAGP